MALMLDLGDSRRLLLLSDPKGFSALSLGEGTLPGKGDVSCKGLKPSLLGGHEGKRGVENKLLLHLALLYQTFQRKTIS